MNHILALNNIFSIFLHYQQQINILKMKVKLKPKFRKKFKDTIVLYIINLRNMLTNLYYNFI